MGYISGLKQALTLDPYFEQTYLMAQGNLPWKSRMAAETIELLDISRRHRPWDWRPGFYMGFDYYYFLNDYAKASEAFLEAAKVKGAPVLLPFLGARFAVKSEQTSTAIVVLKHMLDDAALSDRDRLDLKQRLAALEGVQLLENAINQYKELNHTFPPELETLVEKNIIAKLPDNPYGGSFYYDSQTGQHRL